MTSTEARSAILKELGRTPLSDLYKPGTRITYDAPEIVALISRRLPEDVRDHYVRGSNLSRVAIHASIDKALEQRARHVRTGPRRKRRG